MFYEFVNIMIFVYYFVKILLVKIYVNYDIFGICIKYWILISLDELF